MKESNDTTRLQNVTTTGLLDLRKKSQKSNFETSQVGTIKIFKWVIQNNMEKTPSEINLLTALCFY